MSDEIKEENQTIPEEYKPISMWGYIGYQILFAIPVIGWILLIAKAIGAKNVNVRNFSRSYFCIIILLILFVTIAMVQLGFSFSDLRYLF